MATRTLLKQRIESDFEELKKLTPGTEEYKIAVDGLTKLIDREREYEKLDTETQSNADIHEHELMHKIAELEMEKKNNRIQNGIAIASLVSTAALAVWGTVTSMKFEDNATFTTIAGRSWVQKLLPRK